MKLPSANSLVHLLIRVPFQRNIICNNQVIQRRFQIQYVLNNRSMTTNAYIECWKCSCKHHSELFCPNCQVIQKAAEKNYFTLLKTEPKYNIELIDLKKYYIHLQSLLHPDKFATSPQREQDYSSSYSTLVNEAFKTLNDPIKRGLYLLELNGNTLDSETVEGDDKSILNDIFILNFEVEESEDPAELKVLLQGVEEDISDVTESADKAFIEKDFELAKQAIIKLKYYYNIKIAIEDKLLNLSL